MSKYCNFCKEDHSYSTDNCPYTGFPLKDKIPHIPTLSFNELSATVKALVDDMQSIFNRVEYLENRAESVIDAHLDLHEKVEVINKQKFSEFHHLQPDIVALCSRIDRLESNHLNQQLDPQVWKFLQERLDKLESLIDINKLEHLIFDGAQLHLSVLKFETRMKELEERIDTQNTYINNQSSVLHKLERDETLINRILELQSQLDELVRFQEITRAQYEKVTSGSLRAPYKCPVCEGKGFDTPQMGVTNQSMTIDGITCNPGDSVYYKPICRACDGSGILWG